MGSAKHSRLKIIDVRNRPGSGTPAGAGRLYAIIGLMLLWIIRYLTAVFLGLLVFGGSLAWLVFGALSDKLFSARVYSDALVEADAYQRVYTQVLPEIQPEVLIQKRRGEIAAFDYIDLAGLLPRLAPPDYLQAQVEGNLERAEAYFNGENPRLALYVELEEPLARFRPAALAAVDIERRIGLLEVREPSSAPEPFEPASYVSDLKGALSQSLLEPPGPVPVPSLRSIPEPLRQDTFDRMMVNLPGWFSLNRPSRRGLEAAAPELRQEFIAGDTRQFLKLTAQTIVGLAIDDALTRTITLLAPDSRGRVNLLTLMALESGHYSEAKLRAEAEGLRSDRRRLSQAWVWSLLVVILGAVAMGSLYLPNLAGCLRWPGLTLLLTGAALFLLARLAEAVMPDLVANTASELLSQEFGLYPAAALLASETLRTVVAELLAGSGNPALLLALVGAVLFAAAYGVDWWRNRRQEAPVSEDPVSTDRSRRREPAPERPAHNRLPTSSG